MKKALEEYNKKRDFKKTKEPQGKTPKKKGHLPIFVVQEHHASHLHYDFRLELDGVLKSWAVPKGPSLDPSDKRLAVQTEDHPLEYATFRGTIPKGEYGGGEVFIWDHGTWESEMDDPRKALEKGELKFKLKGKKLKGSFVIVRTRWGEDANKKNWLLIKHKDDKAQTGFSLTASKKTSKKVSKKVIKKEVSKKVVKKKALLEKDPWPDFISPELARLVTGVPTEKNWIYEMKFDGYRMQGQIKKNQSRFFTRRGLDWKGTFPQIMEALEALPVTNAIFDGEVVALDENGASNFQLLQNNIKEGDESLLRYYIFDLLYLNGKDLRSLPLIERKTLLKEILSEASSLLQYSEHIVEGGKEFYKLSCEHKLEGIISKQSDAPYISGRSDLWVKNKCSSRQEFVIGGWTEPRGERVGVGALLIGIYEKGKFRYAGRVGTGFTQESLRSITKRLKALEQENSPFDINSPRGRTLHWVRPELVCEVSFANWTTDMVLRVPVFMGLREDKSPKVVHMEKPKSKAKLSLLKEVSSPEKILFKKERITKKKIADFYEAIAPTMLPYLADRPLSIVRCPSGSEGACFFQKHINGSMPDDFHSFPIKEEKGSGIYFSIDSSKGLRELVQLNAFEIHAWNSHADDYMRPDQIVMDLDPGPGVTWKEVIDAAFELKSMLEDLGLTSFVKLTGGKGLHIHVPIAPLYTWDQIKSFSQGLALELERSNPKKYISNMAKKLRNKKIFVDYLRNGYGATAVVPYSLRAKPTSAIALPVDWKELRRIKGPQEYTMEKALKKIKSRKKDPWAGMLKLKQKIAILTPAKKAS